MIALVLVATALAAESPVAVTARAVPEATRIGAPVRYEVEVAVGPDVEVVLGHPTERLGAFDVVDFGEGPAREQDGRRVVTRWFTLVGWDVGHHLVPSPPAAYREPGGALTPVDAVETRISVESLVGEDLDAATARDIAPPDPIPMEWRGPLALAGAAAALAALGAAAWWLRRWRRMLALGPPPVPVDVRALAALDLLAARRLVERGEVKTYYAELSGIVRRYLEDRFGVRAPEMTTEEFLVTTARGAALGAAHRELLAVFLRESDLVKFARHRPSADAAGRAMDAARRVVVETRPLAEVAA